MEVTGLFLSAIIVVQYFIFQYDQLVFFIPDFILLIALMSFIRVIFLKLKK